MTRAGGRFRAMVKPPCPSPRHHQSRQPSVQSDPLPWVKLTLSSLSKSRGLGKSIDDTACCINVIRALDSRDRTVSYTYDEPKLPKATRRWNKIRELKSSPDSRQEISRHGTLAFDVDLAPSFKIKALSKPVINICRALNPVLDPLRFHPARRIDGISP